MHFDWTIVLQQLANIGIVLLGLALGYVAVFLSGLAKKLLVAKLGQQLFDNLYTTAEIIVRALEQQGIIQHLTGEDKKKIAMVLLRQAADALKLSITDEQLSLLIESLVQALNTEAGKFEAPAIKQVQNLVWGESEPLPVPV
jgi:uncharacterized membrane protein